MADPKKRRTPRRWHIENARADDFPRLLVVWEAAVRATHHFLCDADIQYFRPLVKEAFAHVPHLACVRDDSGTAVGFVGVAGEKIEMLFVHPRWASKGIGRALVEHAVSPWGATLVDVNEQNEQAVGFYVRLGFVTEGRSELDGMGLPFPLLHMRLAIVPSA